MQEEKDNFCNAVRAEVKQAGIIETPENCWDFFIQKACLKTVPRMIRYIIMIMSATPTTKRCATLSLKVNADLKPQTQGMQYKAHCSG